MMAELCGAVTCAHPRDSLCHKAGGAIFFCVAGAHTFLEGALPDLPDLTFECGNCENECDTVDRYLWHPPESADDSEIIELCPRCYDFARGYAEARAEQIDYRTLAHKRRSMIALLVSVIDSGSPLSKADRDEIARLLATPTTAADVGVLP